MTRIASDFRELDGLAQMQAILRGDLHAPIDRTLDFDLIAVERGRVEFEGRISRAVYNPLGTVHGGYAATILDTACGGAAHSSLDAGQGFTTLEIKVAYHRPLTEASGPVRCEGKLISVGRRIAYTEGRLTVDRNDAGYPVYQVLQDFQGNTVGPDGGAGSANGGGGWLRFMEFDVERRKIRFYTYSPLLERYAGRNGEATFGVPAHLSEFELDFPPQITGMR